MKIDGGLGARDPRNPGVQKRLKLAGVQMTPDPFRSMVINRNLGPALRARPGQPLLMRRPDVHAFTPNVQLNLIHLPRVLKTENVPIKLAIFHDSDHLGVILSQPVTH